MHFLNKAEALELVHERRELLDAVEPTNPFAGSTWMYHFIKEVGKESWNFVIPEYLPGGGSLMLLCSPGEKPHYRSALTNYYASLYSPLISSLESPNDRQIAIENLVAQLTELNPKSEILDFSPIEQEAYDTKHLKQAFKKRGWYVIEYDCFGNWHLPCAGMSFDEYMKTRDSKLYNTWVRKRKKFLKECDENSCLEIVVDPREVARAMDAYERVYAKSWKRPEPYDGFVRNWAHLCAQNGWLRLGLAWQGDIPIAAQFWFTMHGKANIFKLAYDNDYSKLSPGTILSAHMFRNAIDEDRVVEIDYLTGDDAYKNAWMTKRRQRIGLLACNPRTPRGLLKSARELVGETRKRWRASQV
jgi:hypothetical protein